MEQTPVLDTLHDRVVFLAKQLLASMVENAKGFDKMVYKDLVPMLMPKIEKSIRSTPELELRQMILSIKPLLEALVDGSTVEPNQNQD